MYQYSQLLMELVTHFKIKLHGIVFISLILYYNNIILLYYLIILILYYINIKIFLYLIKFLIKFSRTLIHRNHNTNRKIWN